MVLVFAEPRAWKGRSGFGPADQGGAGASCGRRGPHRALRAPRLVERAAQQGAGSAGLASAAAHAGGRGPMVGRRRRLSVELRSLPPSGCRASSDPGKEREGGNCEKEGQQEVLRVSHAAPPAPPKHPPPASGSAPATPTERRTGWRHSAARRPTSGTPETPPSPVHGRSSRTAPPPMISGFVGRQRGHGGVAQARQRLDHAEGPESAKDSHPGGEQPPSTAPATVAMMRPGVRMARFLPA